MPHWDSQMPIYQQLAEHLAGQLLEGDPPEGEAMPSIRVLAASHLLNPLTVNRALQALADMGLLESRRGMGLYVTAGARERLLATERQRFLQRDWPRLRERLRRLELTPDQLQWEETSV